MAMPAAIRARRRTGTTVTEPACFDLGCARSNGNDQVICANEPEPGSLRGMAASSKAVEYVTVDEYVNRLGFGVYHWRLLFISGLAWASDAGETMLLSFLGPAALCEWPETGPATEASITTVVFAGMAVGTLLWGRIADWFGRKNGVILSGIATVVAGLASAASPNVLWLILFRMLTGMGIGGVPIVFSMYLELIPTESRGFWATLIQTFWSFGTVGVTAVAWLMLESPGWRWLVAVAAIPLALLTVLYGIMAVESPRYYVDLGKYAEAEQALRTIARINGAEARLGHLRLRPASDTHVAAAHSPLLAGSDTALAPAPALVATPAPAATSGDAKEAAEMSFSSSSSSSSSNSRSRGGSSEADSYGALDESVAISTRADGADGARPADEADDAGGDPIASGPPNPSSVSLSGIGGACRSLGRMTMTTGQALAELVQPEQRRTSLLLWLLWFGNAFAYYGLVLLSTEVRVASSGERPNCKAGQVSLTNDDFMSIFIDTAAEFPGFILAALVADRLGRRYSQAMGFAVAAAACAALVFVPEGAELAETLILFVARAFILLAFTITYLYTPEVYTQHLRALGVAVANAFARIGGMVAPFIGQSLVQTGSVTAAEIIFASVCLVSTVAALGINVETAGAALGKPSALADHQHHPPTSTLSGDAAEATGASRTTTEDDDGISLAPMEGDEDDVTAKAEGASRTPE